VGVILNYKMTTSRISIIVALFFISNVFGQERFFFDPQDVDTIDYSFRTNGTPLEKIDEVNIGTIMLRPAAGFAQHHEHNLAENLYTSPAGFAYLMDEKRAQPRYTGIPYLGFQYAFGQAMNQALNLTYHHYLSEDTHLHFRYHRRGSNGILRQGDFMLNDLNLLFFHKKDRWRTHLDAYYAGYEYAENGGITSQDEAFATLPIEFIEVAKLNANSLVRKADVSWNNYLSMYEDSVVRHGWTTRTNYQIHRRQFTEQPLEGAGYVNIFIDSSQTRDHYQTPSISNGVGYFLATDFLQVKGTFNHRYWSYQNLDFRSDTTELFLHGNLWMGWDKLNVQNEFYLNTLGALGELYNKAKLYFSPIPALTMNAFLDFDNRLPLPYQRFHFANNIQWKLPELQTQQLLRIGGTVAYKQNQGKQKYTASLDWTTVNNGLYFIEDQWRQDTLDVISVGALSVGAEFHTKKWHFYPNVTVRFNTENFSYQPLFSSRNRIAYKKGFFENDALVLSFGADLGYDLGHNYMRYNTLLNVMEPTGTDFFTPDLIRINVFTALEIDQFRFFLRAENIDYFINTQAARVDAGYTITPFLIRLGISWDFFN
jgi:hypothetical protein